MADEPTTYRVILTDRFSALESVIVRARSVADAELIAEKRYPHQVVISVGEAPMFNTRPAAEWGH